MNQNYEHGFITDIESETIPISLTEETLRLIAAKKNEPDCDDRSICTEYQYHAVMESLSDQYQRDQSLPM